MKCNHQFFEVEKISRHHKGCNCYKEDFPHDKLVCVNSYSGVLVKCALCGEERELFRGKDKKNLGEESEHYIKRLFNLVAPKPKE